MAVSSHSLSNYVQVLSFDSIWADILTLSLSKWLINKKILQAYVCQTWGCEHFCLNQGKWVLVSRDKKTKVMFCKLEQFLMYTYPLPTTSPFQHRSYIVHIIFSWNIFLCYISDLPMSALLLLLFCYFSLSLKQGWYLRYVRYKEQNNLYCLMSLAGYVFW